MEILDTERMDMCVYDICVAIPMLTSVVGFKGYYVALVIILVITALVSIYHKKIVDWLEPVTRWLFE